MSFVYETSSRNNAQVPREVDDFKQAGDRYRLQPKDAQQRLVDNIVGSLSQVSRDDIIERSLAHFRKADAEFGWRLAEGIATLRGVPIGVRSIPARSTARRTVYTASRRCERPATTFERSRSRA